MCAKMSIGCEHFPCVDVKHDRYILPDYNLDPERVSMVMISESTPEDPSDYYYAQGAPLFQQNTLQAFSLAGTKVDTFHELLDMGIYFTTAVKCGKTGYGIKAGTIKECSMILEKEIGLFPNIQVIMLMGDTAIKAINYIAKRAGEDRVIPAGSTYIIRSAEYYFRHIRLFPSYLQVGPSFGIEKSKHRMIAEDIKAAMSILE